MKDTEIAWTDHTFNPWRGCEKVSPGCAHCYAETMAKRNPAVLGEWGPNGTRVMASDAAWREVERWNRKAKEQSELWDRGERLMMNAGVTKARRPRVFCASMADWLDPKVPVEWLARLLDTIRRTPNLDWLLLTKRPENWSKRLRQVLDSSWSKQSVMSQQHEWVADWQARNVPPHNVWFGVSAEDQQRWDERVPVLLSIPAKVRFVSVEPMLGPIDMESGTYWSDGKGLVGDAFGQVAHRPHGRTETRTPGIDWVIFGGESGPKARLCNVDWIRDGVRQCREAGVAPFVKQLGANSRWSSGAVYTTKDRKGGDPAEWPEDLRVREWPIKAVGDPLPGQDRTLEKGGGE